MSEKTKIVNVEMQIAGTVFKLTLAQARDLKRILEELFPEPVAIHRDIHHYPITRPVWDGNHYPPFKYPGWDVTCGSDEKTLCISQSK